MSHPSRSYLTRRRRWKRNSAKKFAPYVQTPVVRTTRVNSGGATPATPGTISILQLIEEIKAEFAPCFLESTKDMCIETESENPVVGIYSSIDSSVKTHHELAFELASTYLPISLRNDTLECASYSAIEKSGSVPDPLYHRELASNNITQFRVFCQRWVNAIAQDANGRNLSFLEAASVTASLQKFSVPVRKCFFKCVIKLVQFDPNWQIWFKLSFSVKPSTFRTHTSSIRIFGKFLVNHVGLPQNDFAHVCQWVAQDNITPNLVQAFVQNRCAGTHTGEIHPTTAMGDMNGLKWLYRHIHSRSLDLDYTKHLLRAMKNFLGKTTTVKQHVWSLAQFKRFLQHVLQRPNGLFWSLIWRWMWSWANRASEVGKIVPADILLKVDCHRQIRAVGLAYWDQKNHKAGDPVEIVWQQNLGTEVNEPVIEPVHIFTEYVSNFEIGDDFFFVNPKTQKQLTYNVLRTEWNNSIQAFSSSASRQCDRKLSFSKCTLHSLRHSFVATAMDCNISVELICSISRHKSKKCLVDSYASSSRQNRSHWTNQLIQKKISGLGPGFNTTQNDI